MKLNRPVGFSWIQKRVVHQCSDKVICSFQNLKMFRQRFPVKLFPPPKPISGSLRYEVSPTQSKMGQTTWLSDWNLRNPGLSPKSENASGPRLSTCTLVELVMYVRGLESQSLHIFESKDYQEIALWIQTTRANHIISESIPIT